MVRVRGKTPRSPGRDRFVAAWGMYINHGMVRCPHHQLLICWRERKSERTANGVERRNPEGTHKITSFFRGSDCGRREKRVEMRGRAKTKARTKPGLSRSKSSRERGGGGCHVVLSLLIDCAPASRSHDLHQNRTRTTGQHARKTTQGKSNTRECTTHWSQMSWGSITFPRLLLILRPSAAATKPWA